ncbi:hypothetical protein BDV35DRAFT_399018 [Aspergillus flavus]|uniref:Uncharacterized protein n=1 Tax=Aspergillus flavus TaxID=5059 RepID=A0A5N6GC98_ASPFL|nr:hypothetical protein BDV35DRAFT_399018 [Aspergillus flavus]
MLQRPWLDLAQEPCMLPPSSSSPVLGLPVFPGLGCIHCPNICRARETLCNHLLRVHPETRVGRGGRRPLNDLESLGRPIYCQRFFSSAAGSTFFEIRSSAQAKRLLQRDESRGIYPSPG